MFRHWLIITLRYLRKDARHSMINLLGLTLGLTGAMLITFYIHHGWRYDRHHEAVKAGRTEAAAVLLQAGADPHICNRKGVSPGVAATRLRGAAAEKMAGVFNVVGA
jgi:hypothetical protein